MEVGLHLIMFDIDGTLVDSYGFDEECYLRAAKLVLGVEISADWASYRHATDSWIIKEAIERYSVQGHKVELQKRFKDNFIRFISDYIHQNPGEVREIKGANAFIQYLLGIKNCRVAIATGGYEETAKLKLSAAGIDFSGCSFSSSSEHLSRIEIMQSAEAKCHTQIPFQSKTYFGDGEWDREASKALGYQFILLGNRFEYHPTIKDFNDRGSIAEIIGI